MPIVMINIVLNETWNYMNVMIVQNVLWNNNVWTSNQKQKTLYSQRKIDVEPDFGFMKAILGFTRMSV